MHDDIAEVDEHPTTSRVALDTQRTASRLGRLFADGVRDRLHLPLSATGADHEKVGDGGQLRDVEDKDVLGLLVARGLDDDVRERSRRELAHLYRRCSSMYRSAASGTRERSDRPRAARARSSRELISMSGVSSTGMLPGAFGAPGRAATTTVASERMRAGSRHRSNSAKASLPTIKNSSP